MNYHFYLKGKKYGVYALKKGINSYFKMIFHILMTYIDLPTSQEGGQKLS